MKTETNVTYRVRPEHFSYAPEDFETIDQALQRCNYRNSLRKTDDEEIRFYKGDNCKIQKVTTTVEDITY